MGEKVTISAIVLVGPKADKDLLKRCLASLSWCDEIVKVEPSVNGSFSDRRNTGGKRARGEWLLYVDTDEVVTLALRKEIELRIKNYELGVNAYAIPRKNFIFGKEFRHGGQWPDYVKRLFLRSKFKGWKGELHEEPVFEGKLGHLKNPLIHSKHKNLEEMVDKTNEWSEIEAKLMFESGHPKMNVFRFASAGAREFWLRMVRQMAFLDGTEGIIYGIYQVYSRLISYAKLWEIQLKTNN